MIGNRIAAAGLAAFAAASAIPIPLAQLDFAGVINVFNVDAGDSPQALRVVAGIGGFMTIAVLAVALAGAALTLAGARSARPALMTAALAGLLTAMPFWIPAAAVLGTAAYLSGRPDTPAGTRPSLA
jgi:hypothetical protein